MISIMRINYSIIALALNLCDVCPQECEAYSTSVLSTFACQQWRTFDQLRLFVIQFVLTFTVGTHACSAHA
jgi:hypothetical protein